MLRILLSAVFAAGLFSAAARADDAPAKTKIVFLAGRPSHPAGEHEHRAGSMLLAKCLNESNMNVDAVVSFYGWPKDESIFDGAASVVMYCDGGENHMANAHIDFINALREKGVGVACLHYGVETVPGKEGDAFLDWIGGYFEPFWSVNPTWDANFVTLPDHPVTRGVSPFDIMDEWYYHMRFRKDMESVTPILTAMPPESTLERGDGAHSGNPAVRKAILVDKEPQHVSWVYEAPNGARGFGFSGGHYHKNWHNDNFRKVVLNAICWTAKLEIPEGGVESKTPTKAEMEENLDHKGRQTWTFEE